jgi:hypothetical protein
MWGQVMSTAHTDLGNRLDECRRDFHEWYAGQKNHPQYDLAMGHYFAEEKAWDHVLAATGIGVATIAIDQLMGSTMINELGELSWRRGVSYWSKVFGIVTALALLEGLREYWVETRDIERRWNDRFPNSDLLAARKQFMSLDKALSTRLKDCEDQYHKSLGQLMHTLYNKYEIH